MRSSVQSLFSRISRLVPEEKAPEEKVPQENPAGKQQPSPAVSPASEAAPAAYLQEIHLAEGADAVTAQAAMAAPGPVEVPAAEAALPRGSAVRGNKKPENKFEKLDKLADEEFMRKEPASMPQSKSVRIAPGAAGPHDERRGRVGDQPHAHAGPRGRTGTAGRRAEFLQGAHAGQGLRIPGEARIQPHTLRAHARASRTISRCAADTPATSHSFDHSLAEFSELEMDRYDDFNILSRSLTEISADITEVLTQLDGFVRRVDWRY